MNNKIKKTVIAASLCLVASVTTLTSVEAQWSVIDENSNANKQTLEAINNGIIGANSELAGVRQGQATQVKQVDQYQEDTDKRNRLRDGANETLRRDLNALPTIAQCREMTTRSTNSGALIASSGGGGTAKRLKEYQKSITNNSTAQAGVLKSSVGAGTCAGGMDEAIKGCGSGDMTYAEADVKSSSLKKNYASKTAEGAMDNSFNAEGMKAAEANSLIATMYGIPPSLDPEQVKKNPSYVAVYKPVMSKLNAAFESLMEIAQYRNADGVKLTGVALKKWTDMRAEYKSTLGIEPPGNPSVYELINFAVSRDFAGPPREEIKDPIVLARELNEKMVLSNVIAMQQLKLTETNNILLAHLLAQAVAPTNIENVKAEAAKTQNIK